MNKTLYADIYRRTDFRKHPEKYAIGKGEQGVLIAEPYKSELLPHWRFATPDKAKVSAQTIFSKFLDYKKQQDFVGMDMARKFLQMGFTRARRYANHHSGKKYDQGGILRPQDEGSERSEKAQSAKIFYSYYVKARDDAVYKRLSVKHRKET